MCVVDHSIGLDPDDFAGFVEHSSGGFGKVMRGRYQGVEVCCKEICVADGQMELELYSKLSGSPLFVQFYGYFNREEKMYLVMEFVEQDLRKWLKAHALTEENKPWRLMVALCIVRAVSTLRLLSLFLFYGSLQGDLFCFFCAQAYCTAARSCTVT